MRNGGDDVGEFFPHVTGPWALDQDNSKYVFSGNRFMVTRTLVERKNGILAVPLP